jgi:hypothetical protein
MMLRLGSGRRGCESALLQPEQKKGKKKEGKSGQGQSNRQGMILKEEKEDVPS